MAKKHTYKVALPGGEVITRTTARTYTHVVVYKYDAAKREAFDTLKDWARQEAKNYAYYAKIALHGDGTGSAYGTFVEGEYDYKARSRASSVADAVNFLAKYPTVEDHHAACLASRRAYSANVLKAGWQLAGWCGRYDLALKVKTSDLAGEVLILEVK